MTRAIRVSACAVLTLGVVSIAHADQGEDPNRPDLITPYGLSAAVGGGVIGFLDGDMTDFADVGGAWEVRAAFGTRLPVGAELAYTGGAMNIDALGLDEDARLISTGLEGVIRANVLTGEIQPYAIAGIGWRRYDLTNADFNTSAVTEEDDLLEVPLGVGVAWRYRGLVLDLRAAFRLATGADLVGEAEDGDEPALHTWDTSLRAGWEF